MAPPPGPDPGGGRGAGAERPRPRRAGRELAVAVGLALLAGLVLRGGLVEPHLVPAGSMAPTLLPGDVLLVSRVAYRLRLPFTDLVLLELAAPRRGDVVVFQDPTEPSRRLARRVVGLPGEVVELREQVLHVDGVAQPRLEVGALRYLEPRGEDQAAREDTCRRWREFLDAGPVPRPPRPEDGSAGAGPSTRPSAGPVDGHDLLQCRRVRAGRREGPYGPIRPGHLFVLGDNRDRAADSRAGWEVPFAAVVGRGALIGWSWGPGEDAPGEGAGLRLERLFKPVE